MARKKIKDADQPQVETVMEPPDRAIPFYLRRELEEIVKNSGRVIDFTLPIEELEKICNRANNPPDSWRTRWQNR
jgi:hypothetical protein